MHSLSSIPEPSTGAPTTEPPEVTYHVPSAAVPGDAIDLANTPPTDSSPHDEPDQQVDDLAILLVLLIAGGLLRIVLGTLGPMQGIDPQRVQHAQQQGKDILAAETGNPYPLFDLLALGSGQAGLPAWSVVLLGSLLSLIAVPAAYLIGQTLVGRRVAGLIAAAVIAVHPAVLSASNRYEAPAIALSLVTIGLALLCCVEKRGLRTAMAGAVMLGIAGLAAPLIWMVGLLAGPLMCKLALRRGFGKAFCLGLAVALLGVAPAAGYRVAQLGTDQASLLAEWHDGPAQTKDVQPSDRLLVTMTHTSFQELGQAMHLPLGDAGRLKVSLTNSALRETKRDPVADVLADGWLLLNAALAGLAAISVGVMLVRRRLAEVLILATPLGAMAFTALPPGEAMRLPMLALVGVLAAGLLATRSVSRVDEAAREAKRLAKLAKQETKEHAKQQRELEKHKGSLYAFDQPVKSDQASIQPEPKTQRDMGESEAILTQHEEPAAPISGRPI